MDATAMFLKRLLLLCLISLPVFAGNVREYQLELVLFSHITPTTLASEQWPTHPKVIPPNDADTPLVFTPLNPDYFHLNREVKRLENTPNYHVLYHAGWIISADDIDSAKTLEISTDQPSPEISGRLSISLKRYFNLHFQLYLNEPTDNLTAITNNPIFSQDPSDTFHFFLDQTRRMRSQELNYIAHPLFGALVKITPIKNNPKSTTS